MLTRFRPAKCKTALNLAKSRIKLLKNKKENQLRQMRREVAQLLESGQDQTARIRVEHVVREEKTLAAFELIEIYCELVVARLPIIESQKNCPLDLNEAITSLIFAAPRCGDIPELQDVRKHFIAKYGKELVVSATELRPNCGVSRNLIEKLSVKAPDGPAKVKILTAIAEEHNIKWEPNWFKDEEPMPAVEMPKQQHTEKHGMIQMEPLNFEIADNIQQPQASDSSSQSYSSANIAVNDVPPSSTASLHAKPAESYSDRKARNDFEMDRPNWTMEFKDATAAAQAAAESAERASMAARAAAELSRRDRNEANNVFSNTSSNNPSQRMQQVGGYEQGNMAKNTSSVPLASSGHNIKEGKKVFSNTSFNNQRSERIQVDGVGGYEQGNVVTGIDARGLKQNSTDNGVQFGNKKEYYRESEDSINPIYQEVRQSRDPLPTPRSPERKYNVFESPKHQNYEQDDEFSLHEETAKMEFQSGGFKGQSSAFGDEYGIFSNLKERNKESYSDDEYYGSSHQQNANYDDWNAETAYHSGTFDNSADQRDKDEVLDTTYQKYGLNSTEDIFASMNNNTNEMDNIKEIQTKTNVPAVFDNSGSETDEPDLPSPVKSPPSAFYKEKQPSFSSRSRNTLEVSESFRGSPLYAKLSEPVPMRFDSDGESSENEEPSHRGILVNDDYRKPDVSKTEESRSVYPRSTGKHKLDAKDLYTNQPSSEHPISPKELRDYDRGESENETQSGQESGMELNFELLPTGRRNRQQFDPPYRRGIDRIVIDASSSTKPSQASIDKALGSSSSEAESTEVSVKPKTEKGSNKEHTYSSTIRETAHKDPTGYFYSKDSSSSDDNTLTNSTTTRTLLDAGFSRRTKGSATPSESVRKIQTQTSTSRVRPKTKVSEDVYTTLSPTTEKQMTPKTERASGSSSKAPSRENSAKKADHVHPNLPDFETLTAHMLSLKTKRGN